MGLRLSGALMLAGLALAGCDGKDGGSGAIADDESLIDCAIGKGAWSRACGVEREGDMLTLRHRDGGFRRLGIVQDGRGLVSADGAEDAKLTIIDKGLVEVAIGADRYRLPATVAAKPN
ncbi:hypothetical protein AX777_05170 [Sphingobium yanoikuyae]|uniref:Lipoprotein n=1 Tax=Sphingobium yanoikuyae TaxID=13690 RepID=A0A177JN40_SPHYA|nr:hypothetical protein [Sphingobium yanoikuyae]OAH42642.1 hypothetical protein AX777_05170 [Sphingobium yanoikuyae]PZU67065.1 MAG: hypothetical protein DI554_05115 [Sphingobium sp.]